MKKIVSCLLTVAMVAGTFVVTGPKSVQAEGKTETLAALSYQATSEDAETDLADTYGSKKEGYVFTSGVLADGARLYASVTGEGIDSIKEDDPATVDVDESYSPFRKIEWSKAEYTIGETMGNVVPVMTAGKKNPWGQTPYFLVRLSTKGYENIHFSTELTGSSKGPKNVKLQYSVDGVSFTDVPNANYSIPNTPSTKIMKTAFDLNLNDNAFANKECLYIRIIAVDNATINPDDLSNDPGFLAATGGELAINNIRITGTKITSGSQKQPVSTNSSVTSTKQETTKVTTKKTVTKKVFKLNKKKIKLKKGKTYKLKLTVSPKSMSKKLVWKSSKKKIVKITVSKNRKTCKVKALKKGTTTITVKNKSGKKAKCKVVVK